jgi:hypothetical protein
VFRIVFHTDEKKKRKQKKMDHEKRAREKKSGVWLYKKKKNYKGTEAALG